MTTKSSRASRTSAPRTHHIDRRADAILTATTGTNDDDLLSTPEMAAWLGCSTQWLEIGRAKGYGPPFERLSPRMVRYRRGKVRAWLDERSHRSTAEYAKDDEAA
jgi:predicted DNA-binding transcriptional regulator AlpA